MSTPIGGGYYQPAPQVDFNWFSKGWELFKAQAGTWIAAILIYFVVLIGIEVLVAIPTGVYAMFAGMIHPGSTGYAPPPPSNPFAQFGGNIVLSIVVGAVNALLLGGLYRMALKQARGAAISIGDMFSVGDVAISLIIVGILAQLAETIGVYLCIIPGLILQGLFMFAPLLVVDKRIGPMAALSGSVNMLKSQWVMAPLYYLLMSIVASLGFLLLFVGGLATYPTFLISIAVGYLIFSQASEAQTAGPNYGTPQPGVWPPPPTQGQAAVWPPPPTPGQTPPTFGQPTFGQPPRTSLSGEELDAQGNVVIPPPSTPPSNTPPPENPAT